MAAAVTCLSPNGSYSFQLDGAPKALLVATLKGVLELRPEAGSAEWKETRRGLDDQHVGSLHFEPKRGGIFAGIHGAGLYRSLDSGEHWERRTTGLASEHI